MGMTLSQCGRYPGSKVTAVSNSRTQKEFIDSRCKERGLTNLKVVTADVVTYQTKETFDRVVSVEMFEHMKNYQVPPSGSICTTRSAISGAVVFWGKVCLAY